MEPTLAQPNAALSFYSFWSALFDGLVRYFSSADWNYVYALFHDTLVALDILIFVGIVYVLIEAAPYRPRFVNNPKLLIRKEKKFPTLQTAGMAEKWAEIIKKAESQPPQSLTLAMIEADSFVDDVLKKIGLQGEHFADRLEKVSSQFVSSERLWQAHRARNDVVHTPGYVLAPSEARRHLKSYENFLKELEVLA